MCTRMGCNPIKTVNYTDCEYAISTLAVIFLLLALILYNFGNYCLQNLPLYTIL